MNNFAIFKTDEGKNKLIVVMKTFDSPQNYLKHIEEYLRSICFSGNLYIDQILHSGNTSERFIDCFFDGVYFIPSSFKFDESIHPRNVVRKYACTMFKDDDDLLNYSILTKVQKRLIAKGCYI